MKDAATAFGAAVFAPWLRLLPEPSIADRIAAMEPIKGWKVPDNEERQISLANPDFFTKPRGPSGNKIITAQFDENQYKRLKPQYLPHLKSASYKANSCSEAVIATVLKTFAYFKTGEYDKALRDAMMAKDLGYRVDDDFVNTVKKAINIVN